MQVWLGHDETLNLPQIHDLSPFLSEIWPIYSKILPGNFSPYTNINTLYNEGRKRKNNYLWTFPVSIVVFLNWLRQCGKDFYRTEYTWDLKFSRAVFSMLSGAIMEGILTISIANVFINT